MLKKLRNKQKGFTLIELLIVIAIIGIIAALLIPNFLDALQKAKQKRTVADERNIGTAMFSWITDEVGAAAAGQTATATPYDLTGVGGGPLAYASVQSTLQPRYVQEVPQKDGWKHDFQYYLNKTNPLAPQVAAIWSGGRNKGAPAGPYTVVAFNPTDYDCDIVWADGFFVRWPQKLQ